VAADEGVEVQGNPSRSAWRAITAGSKHRIWQPVPLCVNGRSARIVDNTSAASLPRLEVRFLGQVSVRRRRVENGCIVNMSPFPLAALRQTRQTRLFRS
jgi:hypothetical protein